MKSLLHAGGSLSRIFAFVAPRGVGPTAWTDDEKERTHIRRRFMLLGQTLASMQIYDVCRAVDAVQEIQPGVRVVLAGKDDAAVTALYASLLASNVAAVELANLPTTHQDAPDLLNVLRTLDLPQTVALAAERRCVVLETSEPDAWSYPQKVVERLGWDDKRLRIIATKAAEAQ